MEENSPEWLARTRALLGDAAVERLAASCVCVVGLGAVGAFAVEGLARSGVGRLRVVDFDVVQLSNLNRQLYAVRSTLGRAKVEVAAERILDINPGASVEPLRLFAHRETLPEIFAGGPDLVIDAIDSLAPKVEVIAGACEAGIPVFSALGAATRLDADAMRFGPLMRARGCPLGRLVRKRLRRRGIEDGEMWCVYSEERRNLEAVRGPEVEAGGYERGRRRGVLGSVSTVTGLFGLRLAHEAVLRLSGRMAKP